MINSVLLVTDAWEPQVNGVVRTLNATNAEMRRRGMTVDVVQPDAYRGVCAPMLPGMKLALPPYRIGDLFDHDAVHIATEGPLGHAARKFVIKNGFAFTTAFHTNFADYLKSVARMPTRWTFEYLRRFHAPSSAVMVPTKTMGKRLEEVGFKNVVLWGRGVDTDLFYPPTPGSPKPKPFGPRPYWLNVGRLSKEKNLDAFLSLDLPGTKIVVGDGPERCRLERDYPDAKFLGLQQGQTLAETYRFADVFVFPSRFDTFGLVMAEAISCGLPVAAFPVTGPIDVVEDGVTGILSEDLRDACIRAHAMTPKYRPFSWEVATNQFIDNLVPAR